jgi:integrase
MTRPRASRNKTLPPNLYKTTARGKTYYVYRNPQTKKSKSLGTDGALAQKTARLLNAKLSHSLDVEALAAKVLKSSEPLTDYVKRYLTVLLPARRSRKGNALSPKTLHEYTVQLRHVDEALGAIDVAQITRRHITDFLERFPPTLRNRYRSLLHGLFAHAVAEGRCAENPVAGTLKSTEIVARPRLTMAEFCATYRRAEPWFRRAMAIALRTLQRRNDIAAWTYENNVADGYLLVTQHKTNARLRIRMTRQMRKALGTGTGHIVHRDGAPVSQDMLTRAFQSARPSGVRATFHEIRALGAVLLSEQGIDPQALLGHADPQMTRVYLDRHETKWQEIEL